VVELTIAHVAHPRKANLVNLSFDFSGRTARVTGAEGTRFEICWMFAKAGAYVVPADGNARSLKSTWGTVSKLVLRRRMDERRTIKDAASRNESDVEEPFRYFPHMNHQCAPLNPKFEA
jgi:hypothetical protein